MIICITGMPGSGKSELSIMLKRRGFEEFEMSSIPREQMRDKGIPINNETLRNYSMELRKKYGFDIVAKELIKKIKKSRHANIVIAGVRSDAELKLFRKHLKNLYVIALIAPQKVRYRRLINRGHEDDFETHREFEWREKKEKAYGMESAIDAADFVISNTGTLKELGKNLDIVLSNVKKSASMPLPKAQRSAKDSKIVSRAMQ